MPGSSKLGVTERDAKNHSRMPKNKKWWVGDGILFTGFLIAFIVGIILAATLPGIGFLLGVLLIIGGAAGMTAAVAGGVFLVGKETTHQMRVSNYQEGNRGT